MSSETIFALSSGKGKAGVALIRVSGRNAKEALKAFSVSENIKPREAKLVKLKNENNIIDHALVIYFNSPNSFTGEDIVEFHLHGSIAVTRKVSDILSSINGFRVAEAGEFSKRAFENSKMDLVQAEGLADLISAETEAQAKQSIALLEGEASKVFDSWRERVIEVMAFIEAFVDFPDEDIPKDLDLQAAQKIANIIAEINKELSNNKSERLREGAVGVILGKPNVGKSTLINFLSEREFAIVSDVPGTTRDSLECRLEIKGYPLTLIDTAGIRESSDAIESEGVKRALQKAENADFKIILLSAEEYPNFSDDIVKLIDKNSIILINKSDVKNINDAEINGIKTILVSIKNKVGTDILIDKITEKLEEILDVKESPVITRARHRNSLNEVAVNLNNFLETRKNNLPIELSAETLRSAAFHLGKITGKIDVENILDKIFSEFCIGK